jgi:hypothetical protein
MPGWTTLRTNRWGDWTTGGYGLQLGLEDVFHTNVCLWYGLRDQVERIVIYACGAADTAPNAKQGVAGDGRGLMLALAKCTNAMVFAADQTQWYDPDSMDFGDWEGTLYCFLPSGQYMVNIGPPYELYD